MKMILTKVLLVMIFLSAQVVLARAIKVKIIADRDEAATEVAGSLKARLQATDRYAVSDADAELYLHLNCMAGKEVSGVNGYICSFVFEYYPERLSSLHSTVGTHGLLTAKDLPNAAESVFASFVEATTPEKLYRAQEDMRASVFAYCVNARDKDTKRDCVQNQQ